MEEQCRGLLVTDDQQLSETIEVPAALNITLKRQYSGDFFNQPFYDYDVVFLKIVDVLERLQIMKEFSVRSIPVISLSNEKETQKNTMIIQAAVFTITHKHA